MSSGYHLVFSRLRMMLTASSCALLIGCSALSGGEERATYDIIAPTDFSSLKGGTSAQLLIKEPSAVNILDSERIAIRSDAFQLAYLPKAQWTDSLPKLVQARMIQAFENSKRARAIGRPGEGLLINYQLAFDIRSFEAVVDGNDRAVIELGVKVINERNGRLVGQKTFRTEAPISNPSTDNVVDGINHAFDQAAGDIVRWVLAKI